MCVRVWMWFKATGWMTRKRACLCSIKAQIVTSCPSKSWNCTAHLYEAGIVAHTKCPWTQTHHRGKRCCTQVQGSVWLGGKKCLIRCKEACGRVKGSVWHGACRDHRSVWKEVLKGHTTVCSHLNLVRALAHKRKSAAKELSKKRPLWLQQGYQASKLIRPFPGKMNKPN